MINGFRVRQVRELRSLTQAELAESIGVTQATIAFIEGGRLEPSEEVLNTIALKTGFPPSFFRQETVVNFPLGSLLFRARSTVSKMERLEAHRYAEVLYGMAETLARRVEWKSSTIPRLADDPINAARVTRSELGLSPDTPIANLINTIEKAGVLVIAIPVPIEGHDAFCGWVGSEEKRPVIIIVTGAPGDRLRFSVAHELGHLVMHHGLVATESLFTNISEKGKKNDLETQADQFASELLMPEIAMRQEITIPVVPSSLAISKARWKVSIQALIRRARDLEIITEHRYNYLHHQLNVLGWKKQEPVDIPIEKPRAVRMIAEMLYGIPINYQKLAADVYLTQQFVKQIFELHLGKEEILRSNASDNAKKILPLPFIERHYKS